MTNEPTPLINPLADAIARLIYRKIDPQTDSQLDDCLDIAHDRFDAINPILADDIANAIFMIADSDPH